MTYGLGSINIRFMGPVNLTIFKFQNEIFQKPILIILHQMNHFI